MSRSLYAILNQRFGSPIDAATRREFLKSTLALSAGLLLSGPRAFAQTAQTKPAGKRIVVIGAGFSGLACAHELIAAGYDVTVIEARNRVGGRVLSFSDFIKDKNVEGGGELIGSNHPTWVAYAKKFGLEFLDVTEYEDVEYPIVLDGKKLTGEECENLWEELESVALPKMNADAAKVNVDEPWNTPDAAALDKRTLADWVSKVEASELCRKAITAQLTADNGAATDQQSYLGMITQVAGGEVDKYWTESEVYRCKGGNQQLAMKLAAAIGESRVVLKLPVTEVTLRDKVVVVKCADGRTLEADDVVVSVPPSTWSKIKFNPEIPAALKPQMGVNVKYLSALKKNFWKGEGLAPDSLGNGDIGWTWCGTDGQPGDENVGMVAFSGGPGAARTLEYAKESRDEKYKSQIEAVYPGFGENFVASRYMSWPKDEWTLAGYSFPGPGQVTTIGPMLAKGLGNRIHFAGEHCCYKFVGYMEGGLNSGVTVAKRLAVRDGVAKG